MAITNIGTLQDAVESWMERSFTDSLFLEWANQVADKLMQGELGPDGRTWITPPLRVRSMITRTTLATSNGYASLPNDWLEFERVWIDSSSGYPDLTYYPVNQFRTHSDSVTSGVPSKYTLDGTRLYIAPTTDQTLQISYYTKLGSFTGDSSFDAVLTNHPRVYLAGCIAEACGYVQDYEREAREGAKFSSAVRALNASEGRAQASGLIIMRPQSVA